MSIIPGANSNLFFRMNSLAPEVLSRLEYTFNKYDTIAAVGEIPGLAISRDNSRKTGFDCSATFYRENSSNPFIQWHFLLPGRMHYQKDIVLKKLLGSTLSGALPPSNFIFSYVNIRELSRSDLFSLIKNTLFWCVDQGGKYISPYCENGAIVRNWLAGEYGNANVEFCAPTLAANKFQGDKSAFIQGQGIALVKIFSNVFSMNSAKVSIAGQGKLSSQLAEGLRSAGYECQLCQDVLAADGEILILTSMPNCISENIAGKIKGKKIIELLPEQIDPFADKILKENDNFVLPEFFNDVSAALMEKNWEKSETILNEEVIISGLTPVITDIAELAVKEDIKSFDAAVMTAEKIIIPWLNAGSK